MHSRQPNLSPLPVLTAASLHTPIDLHIVTFPRVPGFSGLGLVLTGGPPVVISDIDAGGPAFKGGARPGDCIVEVNARRCYAMGHHDVVQLLAAAVAVEARRREALQHRPSPRTLTRRESGMSLLMDAATPDAHIAHVNVTLPGMLGNTSRRATKAGGGHRRRPSAARLERQLSGGVRVGGTDAAAHKQADHVARLRAEAHGQQARADELLSELPWLPAGGLACWCSHFPAYCCCYLGMRG